MRDGVNDIPVAIAGGGPVGLMLALFLDRHGVRSAVFNSEETTRWHPKGSTHNARTMEHHRRLGIADKIRAHGLPADHPTDVAYFTRFNGFELARLRMPSAAETLRMVASSAKTDQVPEPLHRGNQMYVEAFLLEHARTRPNIAVRFGWQVTGFAQDKDGVSVEVERNDGGDRQSWRAQYLVGCDGGRSFVRRSLGVRYSGEETLEHGFFAGRTFASYLRAPTLYRDFLGGKLAFQYWAVNPQMRTNMMALNGKDEFLFWMKPKGEAEPSDDLVRQAVRQCVGADIPFEIIGHQPWLAGVALVAERFAQDRVLLAGDAVHLFTPTGGFGMNTGIDDAANLAWKLAALLQGWGGPALLETYEAERKPVALRNTKAARGLSKHVGDVEVAAVMEEDSEAGAAARRSVGAVLSTFGEQYASIGVQLGARYDGSPITIGDDAPPPDNFIAYAPTSVPGGRAPHVWLDHERGVGSSLYDRLGVGFTLLRLTARTPAASSFAAAARDLNIPLTVLDLPDPEARALYDRDLVLVRPDQHVAWRGNDAPHDARTLLARTTGREPL